MARPEIPESLWQIYQEACLHIGEIESDRMRLAVLGLIGSFEQDVAKIDAALLVGFDQVPAKTSSAKP